MRCKTCRKVWIVTFLYFPVLSHPCLKIAWTVLTFIFPDGFALSKSHFLPEIVFIFFINSWSYVILRTHCRRVSLRHDYTYSNLIRNSLLILTMLFYYYKKVKYFLKIFSERARLILNFLNRYAENTFWIISKKLIK